MDECGASCSAEGPGDQLKWWLSQFYLWCSVAVAQLFSFLLLETATHALGPLLSNH